MVMQSLNFESRNSGRSNWSSSTRQPLIEAVRQQSQPRLYQAGASRPRPFEESWPVEELSTIEASVETDIYADSAQLGEERWAKWEEAHSGIAKGTPERGVYLAQQIKFSDKPRLKQVIEEEYEIIREQRLAREEECPGSMDAVDERFSLAFSGGGIRAAAFQAGVLWRLAEEGMLKNVDYWVAVSGGAYITSAFASHLQEAKPRKDEDIDRFYLRVVATTLTRMQKNAGNFIRDPAQVGWRFSRDMIANIRFDSDWPPRIFDPIIVALYLVAAIVLNPLLLVVMVVIPGVEIFHLFFAAPLRQTWCSGERWLSNMEGFQNVWELQALTIVLCGASFLTFVLFKLTPVKKEAMYLFMRATTAFLTRLFMVCVIILGMLHLIPLAQHTAYGCAYLGATACREGRWPDEPDEIGLCTWYAQRVEGQEVQMFCADNYQGSKNPTSSAELTSWVDRTDYLVEKLAGLNYTLAAAPQPRVKQEILIRVIVAFGTAAAGALVLLPVAPDILLQVVFWFVPAIMFGFCVAYAQFRVFGPVTGQLFLGVAVFSESAFDWSITSFMVLWIVLLICYSEVRRTWHIFYRRSLCSNFFRDGTDCAFIDQLEQPFCPFIIFTGTVNDFRPPGSDDSIGEISFSALHMGGKTTGYVRSPRHMTLAKATALTGAGCLDAITLSLNSDIRYRFWLTMLDLCWGDYVLFLPQERRFHALIRRCCGGYIAHKAKEFRFLEWLLHRMPEIGSFLLMFTFFAIGHSLSHGKGIQACRWAVTFQSMAVTVTICVMGISFYAYTARLRWWMFSPLIRQYHQLTKYTYESRKPPGVLYVTDGGVQECTGIRQLLLRRCRRILLAYAASDPVDQLAVLRKTLDMCRQEKLASFFNPDDPRSDLTLLLDSFRDDKEMMYLHVGILYPEEKGRPKEVGKVVLMKNRLPPSWTEEGENRFTIHPLLTEKEVQEGVETWAEPNDPIFNLHPEDLGGLGCCDCCHRRGLNCGRKFPVLTGLNYLTLTPQLFNCSVRLGRAVAPAAIAELLSDDPPAETPGLLAKDPPAETPGLLAKEARLPPITERGLDLDRHREGIPERGSRRQTLNRGQEWRDSIHSRASRSQAWSLLGLPDRHTSLPRMNTGATPEPP